jgi:hypothetical protein
MAVTKTGNAGNATDCRTATERSCESPPRIEKVMKRGATARTVWPRGSAGLKMTSDGGDHPEQYGQSFRLEVKPKNVEWTQ